MAKMIKITWKNSTIGHPEKQERIIASLGLKKLNQTVIKEDTPEIRGQVTKVLHLVQVEEVE